MKQVSSLKEIDSSIIVNVKLANFPGAEECLAKLTVLSCRSNFNFGFLYQLSQICHSQCCHWTNPEFTGLGWTGLDGLDWTILDYS